MMMDEFFPAMEALIQNLTHIPYWLDEILVELGGKPALDLTYLLTYVLASS